MNRIALEYKANKIQNSAKPLHERKEKAKKEAEKELTFDEVINKAMVSHARREDKTSKRDGFMEDTPLDYPAEKIGKTPNTDIVSFSATEIFGQEEPEE